MTMLVSKYKIEVKEEPEFAGETFVERLSASNGIQARLDYNDIYMPKAFLRIASQACPRALGFQEEKVTTSVSSSPPFHIYVPESQCGDWSSARALEYDFWPGLIS